MTENTRDSLLTDLDYALRQLAPLADQDRIRRAMDALERVQESLDQPSRN